MTCVRRVMVIPSGASSPGVGLGSFCFCLCACLCAYLTRRTEICFGMCCIVVTWGHVCVCADTLFRFDELEQHCIPRASFAKLVRQIHDEIFRDCHDNFAVSVAWCVKNVVTGVVDCVLVTICVLPVFCALCCCVPVACSLAQAAALYALQAAAEAHLVGALRDAARCAAHAGR